MAEGATFRSDLQEKCIMNVLKGKKDGLAILRTGSGKSMLFMVPAILNKNMMCIVIVPLVALQQDLIRKCAQAGIGAACWKDRNSAGTRIVFCSAEHVVKVEYRSFVGEHADGVS